MKLIILAGGKGTRISEYTTKIPKPMVRIRNKPIITYIIDHYLKYGVKEILIAGGYKYSIIRNYFNKNKKKYPCVKVINTGLNSLTSLRIYKLKNFFQTNENFYLTYGDGVSNINIKNLLKNHIKQKKICTLTAVRPPARFGELKIRNNKVIDFNEKPQLNEGWINGGFFVMNSNIFNILGKKNQMLEREPMQKLLKTKNINAFMHNEFWMCMDTLRDKINLEKIILKKMKMKK